MPRRRADCSMSAKRGFLAPASTSTSRTWSASCPTAAATALMPTTHWFCLLMAAIVGAPPPPRPPVPCRRRGGASLPPGARGPPGPRRCPLPVFLGQPEVDLALLQAGLEHHDPHPVAEAELAARAFAGQG